ncbi:telomere repeat-binding protein 5-like [Iris pallida]|uniref:Telomere repeat-binding protein 5-like n=1 Tax=Iris pallida TaxID=29817 RepID=A0AAX6EGB6_IRIPA|nr:telomere repeat-binding protein 5-like [Iris pallida]
MVLTKRLDCGFNGYHVPPVPRVPKSAKGKRSVRRKKTAENRMSAIDMLAAVAGKLLLEGEGSLGSRTTGVCDAYNLNVKRDHTKPLKNESFDMGSCTNTLGSNDTSQWEVGNDVKLLSTVVMPAPTIIKSDTSSRDVCTERPSLSTKKSNSFISETAVYTKDLDPCGLENRMDVDARLLSLVVPLGNDSVLHSRSSPRCREDKLAVDKDDDKNSSGCAQPSFTTNKAFKPRGLGERRSRISKQLATKFWKVAPTMTKDRELSKTDVEMKPNFYRRRICYAHQRTQRSLFKRRKSFQRCSISASGRGGNNRVNGLSSTVNGMSSYEPEDFHGIIGLICLDLIPFSSDSDTKRYQDDLLCAVKLSIKAFKVPELFVEIPENSTVASLKRTVMDAVTAIIGGGLRIGVLVQGKKVRDDSKTLLQAGISHVDRMDELGFTLEPNSNQTSARLDIPEECYLPPCDFAEPLARFPATVPSSDGVNFDICLGSPLAPIVNCPESDRDSVHSPSDTMSLDKNIKNARVLIAIPSMSVETPPMTPVHKPRRPELIQRRIRRPFSVSEVEALVQAVEKLGTGRWRDVKIRAFDNAKHRTYVDLKDKWKTLVHTARIAPQQRRGAPVPQELLDRVLAAHAYWSQQQVKLLVKSPVAEGRLLL